MAEQVERELDLTSENGELTQKRVIELTEESETEEDWQDLDLTKDPWSEEPAEREAEPYNQTEQHDKVRAGVTYLLIALLFLVVIGVFGAIGTWKWLGLEIDSLNTLLTLVFTPVVTLVGTTLGFYFGGKTQDGTKQG